MPVRFYIDADLLGLAKLLVTVRSDVTYPGDPGGTGPDGHERAPCPSSPGAKDPMWIPAVAAQGWITITRDRHRSTVLPSAKRSSTMGRASCAWMLATS